MPIRVDHAQRRIELVEVAVDLIVEHGLEGASVRAIAARAGYSTVVVAHYFRNKAELLKQAFEHTIEQTARRFDEAVTGGADLLTTLETFLPIEPVAMRTWKVWFAFWGTALSDPEHRQVQAKHGREGKEMIEQLFRGCGDIPPDAAGGWDVSSERLVALIAGIAALSTFDPDRWTPARQRQILSAELEALRKQDLSAAPSHS